MKILENLNNYKLFLIYFALTALLYYSTNGAGMIFDFNGWTALYQTGTYKDVLNSFGYPGLHQMEQFAFFSLFKLFGFSKIGWYISFAFLHSVTAFVAFKFLNLFLEKCKIEKAYWIALLTSFLFLISPLAADTVVNKVTVHYFTSAIFIYSALFYEIKYYGNKKLSDLLKVILLFILALFSLEISYVFPMMFLVVWLALEHFNKGIKIKSILKSPIVIPFITLIGFLLLHKIVIGSFIGHYGADVHTKFDIAELFSNTARYFASYFVLFDYWNYSYKDFVSVKLMEYAYFFILVIVILIGFLYYKMKEEYSKLFWILLASLFLSLFALAPIANLYYAYLLPIENDRYAYLASLFMYLIIGILIFQIKKKQVKLFVIGLFIFLNMLFLIKNVNTFSKASILAWNLLDDFRWFDKEVILLNDPDNFGGAKMFSTIVNPSSFSESLLLHTGIDRTEHIHIAFQMNFKNLSDSVTVTKIDEKHYKIQMAQWGNWFWKNMIGADSFENEKFKVNLNRKGMMSYDLWLKASLENTVILYVADGTWKEVK